MQYATWRTIEASPLAMRLYRSYRTLPEGVRAPARWAMTPRWQTAAAIVRTAADGKVMSGPFKDMKVALSPVSNRNLLGYLLGTQEIELWDVVERIIATNYKTLVNVGVADGYYAIGFARRMPSLQVVGFEGLAYHHPLVKAAAKENGVAARIRLEGFCLPADLARELSDCASNKTLVLADIEGGEKDLLDPAVIPALRNADMLIETHDCFAPGCTASLLQRFAETHHVLRIKTRKRTLEDFPRDKVGWLSSAMPKTALGLMDERRVENQEWLYLTTKAN